MRFPWMRAVRGRTGRGVGRLCDSAPAVRERRRLGRGLSETRGGSRPAVLLPAIFRAGCDDCLRQGLCGCPAAGAGGVHLSRPASGSAGVCCYSADNEARHAGTVSGSVALPDVCVGVAWRILGISWSGLGPLFGALFAATAISLYAHLSPGCESRAGRVRYGRAERLAAAPGLSAQPPRLRQGAVYARPRFVLLGLLVARRTVGRASCRSRPHTAPCWASATVFEPIFSSNLPPFCAHDAALPAGRRIPEHPGEGPCGSGLPRRRFS